MSKRRSWDRLSSRAWIERRIDAHFEQMTLPDQLDVLRASARRRDRRADVRRRLMQAESPYPRRKSLERRERRKREVLKFLRDTASEVLGGIVLIAIAALIAAGLLESIPWLLIAKILLIALIWTGALFGVAIRTIGWFMSHADAGSPLGMSEEAREKDRLQHLRHAARDRNWAIAIVILAVLATAAVVAFIPV